MRSNADSFTCSSCSNVFDLIDVPLHQTYNGEVSLLRAVMSALQRSEHRGNHRNKKKLKT